MSTLGEHQGNGIRFDIHLSAPNGGVAQMLCRPEGQWVSWNEYEKLKAEVERLRLQVGTDAIDREHGMCCDSSAENARLKAEVEAYRSASDEVAAAFLALPAPHNQVGRVCEGISRLKAEVERLTKAEVERLRKEGEAMYPNLGPGWSHNAKEGKQP